MALLYSTTTLTLLPSLSPAKTKTPTANNHLILRTPPLDLHTHPQLHSLSSSSSSLTLRATPSQNHTIIYPDPIPEFADAETRKFKVELKKRLKRDEGEFGGKLDEVVNVCAKILHDFLRNEYGGPGTLLVEPFTSMVIALKDNKLPGVCLAARASLLWAQNHIDHDWQIWNSNSRDQVNHIS